MTLEWNRLCFDDCWLVALICIGQSIGRLCLPEHCRLWCLMIQCSVCSMLYFHLASRSARSVHQANVRLVHTRMAHMHTTFTARLVCRAFARAVLFAPRTKSNTSPSTCRCSTFNGHDPGLYLCTRQVGGRQLAAPCVSDLDQAICGQGVFHRRRRRSLCSDSLPGF